MPGMRPRSTLSLTRNLTWSITALVLPLLLGACSAMSNMPGTLGQVAREHASATEAKPTKAEQPKQPVTTTIAGAAFSSDDCWIGSQYPHPLFAEDVIDHKGQKYNPTATVKDFNGEFVLPYSTTSLDQYTVLKEGPMGVVGLRTGLMPSGPSEVTLADVDQPQTLMRTTGDLAEFCQAQYQGRVDPMRIRMMGLDQYTEMADAYPQLEQRVAESEPTSGNWGLTPNDPLYWTHRTAPYLVFDKGSFSKLNGDPLTGRERLNGMDFLRESSWPTLYIPSKPACNFYSSQADESRFIFTDARQIAFRNAFPFQKATVTDNDRLILTLTPNGDHGKLTRLSASDSAKLLDLFQGGGDFRVNLFGTQGVNRSHTLSLDGFADGYRHYQDCRAKL